MIIIVIMIIIMMMIIIIVITTIQIGKRQLFIRLSHVLFKQVKRVKGTLCKRVKGTLGTLGKRVKGTLSTSVRDHMFDCDHTAAWEDFSIIGRESNHYLLETKESLFIKRDNPSLNRNKYSQELFLF